jgi:tetratricopeptide (TPR) repeat protein
VLVVAALLVGAVAARRARPWLTFAACWFFLILAPTSSIVPLPTEMVAERRMYLPSAAVVALVVLGLRAVIERLGRGQAREAGAMRTLAAAAVVVAVAGLGFLSARRVQDYATLLSIWTDSVRKAPGNPVAQNNLGMALAFVGRADEALEHFREALRLDPERPTSHYNIGFTLAHQGKFAEAIGYIREALRINDRDSSAHYVLATALVATGARAEAIRHFDQAVTLDPGDAEAHREMANALVSEGDLGGASRHFEEAIRLDPGDFRAHSKYGNLLTSLGRHAEAAAHYREALRVNPKDARTRNNLATALLLMGKVPEAVTELEHALQDDPRYGLGHYNLANMLTTGGHPDKAAAHYLEAMRVAGRDTRLLGVAAQKLALLAPQVPEAASALAAAAQDPDPAVREAAGQARGPRRP